MDTFQRAHEELLLTYIPPKGKGKKVPQTRAIEDECSAMCF